MKYGGIKRVIRVLFRTESRIDGLYGLWRRVVGYNKLKSKYFISNISLKKKIFRNICKVN